MVSDMLVAQTGGPELEVQNPQQKKAKYGGHACKVSTKTAGVGGSLGFAVLVS